MSATITFSRGTCNIIFCGAGPQVDIGGAVGAVLRGCEQERSVPGTLHGPPEAAGGPSPQCPGPGPGMTLNSAVGSRRITHYYPAMLRPPLHH